MYAKHFKLSERLFSGSPENAFFAANPTVKGALKRVRDVLLARDAMAVITGGPGVGKSAFIAAAHAEIAERSTVIAVDLRQTDPALLASSVLAGLGAAVGDSNEADSLQRLRVALRAENDVGRKVTAVVDVTGLTVDRAKRILQLIHVAGEPGCQLNIIILGPHALHRLLNAPGLIHLRQRVAFRYRIRPFDAGETRTYLEQQFAQAGGNFADVFGDGAVAAIFRYVGGVPRLMNTLVDAVLSQAVVVDAERVESSLIEQTARELGWRPLASGTPAAKAPSPQKVVEKPAQLSLRAESNSPPASSEDSSSASSLNAQPEAVSESTAALLLDARVFEASPEPEAAAAKEAPSEKPGVTPEMPSMVPEMDPNDTSATGMLKLEDLDARFAETIFGEDASAAASNAIAAKPEITS